MVLPSLARWSLAVALSLAIHTVASAQTVFPELEPNTNKNEADLVAGMASGDAITGTTTGATTVPLSVAPGSVDYFRVRTAPLPLGVYAHALTLTTTGTPGHVGTIRGRSQTNGVVNATSDVAFQTSADTTTPARTNVWYGFGREEEIHYRVTGIAATTAPYRATLSTTPVTPIAIPGVFTAGPITLAAPPAQPTDTEIYVYDANFDPVPGGHNDDPIGGGGAGPSFLTVNLPLGTYYVAIADFNTANDQSDLDPNEHFDNENVLEFPRAVANDSTNANVPVSFSITDGSVTTPVTATRTSFFQVLWYRFVVGSTGGPPPNDDCAQAAPITAPTISASLATATHDGTASCDPGGAASKDVWYSYQAGPNGGTLSLDTCGSLGADTAVSVTTACGGVELACSDACGGSPCGAPAACLAVTLAPHQIVLVRVSDQGTGGGGFLLNSAFVAAPPANDACANPTPLSGPGTYFVSTESATTSGVGQSESMCVFAGTSAVVDDVWYAYVPTTSGTVTVSTCGVPSAGSSFDTKLAVYPGAACPANGSALACGDDSTCALSGLLSSVSFAVTCGAAYTIQLGSGHGGAGGGHFEGTLNVSQSGSACATPFTSFCAGDGTGNACPCGNSGATGHGCANSVNANGAVLTATGIASISGDTWTLQGSGVPNGPGLYFQGTNQVNAGNGTAFGDGKRCAGGTIVRLGIVTATGNASTYPSSNPPAVNAIPISLKGFNVAGNVRNYQLWYRDSTLGFCASAAFNLSNAIQVSWGL